MVSKVSGTNMREPPKEAQGSDRGASESKLNPPTRSESGDADGTDDECAAQDPAAEAKRSGPVGVMAKAAPAPAMAVLASGDHQRKRSLNAAAAAEKKPIKWVGAPFRAERWIKCKV